MSFRHPIIAWSAIALLLCVFAAPALAKESDAESPKAEEELTSDNSAVSAILATVPTTPAECVRAAKILTDLGDPDMAKRFVKKVLDANLQPEQLVELGEEFDAALFLDLAGQKKLLPEARQLADAVVAAVAAKREDAKRITGLIEQLQDSSADTRARAMVGLQEARETSIGLLIAVLADPARSVEHTNVRTVLANMGHPAQQSLIAVLGGADPKLTVQAILTLAEMNQPKTAMFLLGPCFSEKSDAEVRAAAVAALKRLTGSVPTRSEAARQLSDAAKLYFSRKQPIEGVVDGKLTMWHWNEAKRQCVAHQGTFEDASRVMAARLAREAHSLAPDNSEIRLLYLTAMLDAAVYAKGLDRPLDDKDPAIVEAKPFGVKTIDAVLDYAIVHQHPAAAAAARLLGEIGKADELLYQGDKPAALARAVQQPDRRLRMAALQAIVRLKPAKPFPGSSYVPGALAYFAGSSGVRHALVAGPNAERIRDVTGLLAAAGFQVDATTNGKELLRMGTQSPDYEVAFIDVSMSRPDVALLLQELRRDPRTALLPVGLIARDGYIEQANRLADADPLSKAFARPQDKEAIRWQLDQLATLAPQEVVDFKTRQQQAADSLDLLAELSRTSGKLYDLRRAQDSVLVALYNPKLSIKAVAILADMNSPESQRALADLAGRFVQPLEVRQAAAKAFGENVRKHGILLTTDEISEQYRRYNDSEKQDVASQKALSLILDCLEVRTKPTK